VLEYSFAAIQLVRGDRLLRAEACERPHLEFGFYGQLVEVDLTAVL
jgi:hypothetical protein